MSKDEWRAALDDITRERDTLKSRAIQLRNALLWAKERLVPSGLVNADEIFSIDEILEETRGIEG